MKWSKRKCKWAALYFWREWAKPVLVASAIVLPFKSAIADWNWVPTGSMKPTILEGDLVLVNKLAYDLKVPFTLWRLARGDIVVFFSPQDGTRLVKRVVAGPGDTLEMRGNVLFLNGRALRYDTLDAQPFAQEIHEDAQAVIAREIAGDRAHLVMALPSRHAMRSFDPVIVPEGKYFVMGDSRDNSFDSRYFGFVEREQIVGRSGRVLLSFDKHHRYTPRLSRSLSALDAEPGRPSNPATK
jgi:signal peptidase I